MGAVAVAVAPGGTLLGVWHALGDQHGHAERPAGQFDPADFHGADDVVALLRRPDSGFVVDRFETRPRHDPPSGSRHVDDVVLRATRTGS